MVPPNLAIRYPPDQFHCDIQTIAFPSKLLNKMDKELSAGTTHSHCGIVSKIGVCGMRKVYRARDTRLEREVVIKILPQFLIQFVLDEDNGKFRSTTN